jgi:hypothetical protein
MPNLIEQSKPKVSAAAPCAACRTKGAPRAWCGRRRNDRRTGPGGKYGCACSSSTGAPCGPHSLVAQSSRVGHISSHLPNSIPCRAVPRVEGDEEARSLGPAEAPSRRPQLATAGMGRSTFKGSIFLLHIGGQMQSSAKSEATAAAHTVPRRARYSLSGTANAILLALPLLLAPPLSSSLPQRALPLRADEMRELLACRAWPARAHPRPTRVFSRGYVERDSRAPAGHPCVYLVRSEILGPLAARNSSGDPTLRRYEPTHRDRHSPCASVLSFMDIAISSR